jgi:hypothetical protein
VHGLRGDLRSALWVDASTNRITCADQRGSPPLQRGRCRRRSGPIGQVAGWRPDLPDARHEPFIPLLRVKVHELHGRVPAGSTARFVQDGMLPAEAAVYRLAG